MLQTTSTWTAVPEDKEMPRTCALSYLYPYEVRCQASPPPRTLPSFRCGPAHHVGSADVWGHKFR
jgi:hypothetical protein